MEVIVVQASIPGTHLKDLPHRVIVKAPGLLPMLYTPSELADELGVSSRSIRKWIKSDLPHQRDGAGRLWFNGRDVADWVRATQSTKRTPNLGPDEAYCF